MAVCVRGVTRERRLPFGTPVETLDRTVHQLRTDLARQYPQTPRGTLGADADRYELTIRDLVSFVARRAEIRAWVKAIGAHRYRSQISHADIRRIRGDWIAAGVSPKTINNRVFALHHLYRTLDGKHVPTPCDDVKPLPTRKRPAVRVPDALIRDIYQALVAKEQAGELRDAKTRARFAVFASTGHRPSEIGRAAPSDVDVDRRIWTPRDGKGGFCPGVYLNDDMLEAWKIFIAADAWGPFDCGSFAQRIRNAGLPPHIAPYQLRHTVGIAASEIPGVDLRDVADHLGHKRAETTRRHYVPVLNSRLQRLSEALGARQLGWKANLVPDAVPDTPDPTCTNVQKSAKNRSG